MSNHCPRSQIITHHDQVEKARKRRIEKAEIHKEQVKARKIANKIQGLVIQAEIQLERKIYVIIVFAFFLVLNFMGLAWLWWMSR